MGDSWAKGMNAIGNCRLISYLDINLMADTISEKRKRETNKSQLGHALQPVSVCRLDRDVLDSSEIWWKTPRWNVVVTSNTFFRREFPSPVSLVRV